MTPSPQVGDDTGSSRSTSEKYLSSRQVRARYGDVSAMWVWRRLNDDSGFPKPIKIGRLNYWKESALVAFERKCAKA